jgi:hypothetical protein
MKVDMVEIISATRESVLSEYNDDMNGMFVEEILENKIYTTEKYEIFYYKYKSSYGEATAICGYYFYANGERFRLYSYIFGEDKPEYNDVFKRIAESVDFQSKTAAPATGDSMLIYIAALLIAGVILYYRRYVFWKFSFMKLMKLTRVYLNMQ